ncbi:NigD1/NigD2 family lipoprotein [Labilibacter marinus]|uniref:NigD1/NigD2 family lipoprotein n=1 Tax=Labilibacter marinus TaxID=1477105 RepID=UPI000832DC97|nr:NigD-like C-terminal domain-containing protein [Labilibacter marinus]
MKNLISVSGIIVLFLLTACQNNYDSFDECRLSVGTVTKNAESFFIITDGGMKLWPIKSRISESLFEDGMRVLIDYSIWDEYENSDHIGFNTTIHDVSQILTKPIFLFNKATSSLIVDSIGNDPINILDAWLTDDYMNVRFEYEGGSKLHFLNLVFNTEAAVTYDGEIILELRHNMNDDAKRYRHVGIASFDISSLKNAKNNSIDIFIRSLSKGEYTFNKSLTYEYDTQTVTEIGKVTRSMDKASSGNIAMLNHMK